MSYIAFCTFDLKDASRQDYQTAYDDLDKLGLKKVVVHNDGTKVVIPTTSVCGTFTGANASAVCKYVAEIVQNAFRARRFSSEIFVLIGGDWAWVGRTT